MIHVKRPPTPTYLDGATSPGGRERAKCIAFYGVAGNKLAKFPFKAYKADPVKEALTELFGGKCAYCEAFYEQAHPVDVEHFRPKGGFARDTKLETPGYYWLAAEWSNLLPSCVDCNRARYQKFSRLPYHMTGKANKFPLATEARRARRPGQERHESPLLLDPCRDHPEEHLLFDDHGNVDPTRDAHGRVKMKGKVSIEVFGLDRDPTVRARRRVLKFLCRGMERIERLSLRLDERPGDRAIEQELRDEYRELIEFTEPTSEFAQMARQVISRFEARLL
jgi:uncharacterized protein (TIGR02646 family)